MFPALRPGDRLRLEPIVGALHRGDIVSHEMPPPPRETQPLEMVHRIVGLPGERLEPAPDGTLLVNGAPLAEPYLPPGIKTYLTDPLDIPADHYVLLGDNRQYSSDSRMPSVGPIARAKVLARVTEVIEDAGFEEGDCPESDPSMPDPRTAPPLTVKDTDPPGLQLSTQKTIAMAAASQKVTSENLDAVRSDLQTQTDRLEALIDKVPADGSDADRIVRTEFAPALREMIAAQTLDEWTARRETFAVVVHDWMQALRHEIGGN